MVFVRAASVLELRHLTAAVLALTAGHLFDRGDRSASPSRLLGRSRKPPPESVVDKCGSQPFLILRRCVYLKVFESVSTAGSSDVRMREQPESLCREPPMIFTMLYG